MADDALTDAGRTSLLACLDNVGAAQVDEVLHEVACIKAQARAEGARDALNDAADELSRWRSSDSQTYAAWLRERAARQGTDLGEQP